MLRDLARAGVTYRQAEVRTGINWATCRKYMMVIERPPCPCGRPAGHRGNCAHRKATMPRVAAFLLTWRKLWTPEMDSVLRQDWDSDILPSFIAGRINRDCRRNDMTGSKIQARAAYLKLRRPEYFNRVLRQRGISGRRLGRKNNATLARLEARRNRCKPKPARNALIVERYRSGDAMMAIARDFGVSRQLIHSIIKKVGGLRPNGRTGAYTRAQQARKERGVTIRATREAFYRKIMPEVINLRRERWDFKFIARKFGRCPDTIRDHLKLVRPDLCGQGVRAINVNIREYGYGRSPIRTNFIAHWVTDVSDDNSFRSIMAKVMKFLPVYMDQETRDDAVQTASVMFLENPELGADPKALAAAAVRNFNREYGQWNAISLDAPRPGMDDKTWMDSLASPEPEISMEEYLDAKREQEIEFGVR